MKVTLALVVFAGAVLAQRSESDKCMDKADTQLAMNMCADQEAKRVEAQLESVYRQVLDAARKESGAVPKIEASQKAWLAYRDSYLGAMYPADDKLANYGSKWPADYSMLKAEFTRQQITRLQALLKAYRTGAR